MSGTRTKTILIFKKNENWRFFTEVKNWYGPVFAAVLLGGSGLLWRSSGSYSSKTIRTVSDSSSQKNETLSSTLVQFLEKH